MGGDVGAKNGDGDVEIAWDSSEVGADTEIEYVPLVRVEGGGYMLTRVEHPSSTNMGGGYITQNIPPSPHPREGTLIDEWVLAVMLAILWVVFWVVVDIATTPIDSHGMGIFLGTLSAPFFVGTVLALRFCWLNGPDVLSYWLRELREFFRKN